MSSTIILLFSLVLSGPSPAAAYRDFDKGFPYKQIAGNLIGGKATPLSADECEQECTANPECIGWEVCAPIGSGCDGCYQIKTIRPEVVDHPGWHVGLIDSRAEGMPIGPAPIVKPTTSDGCKEFILKSNGGDPGSEFHKPENMEIYNWCGEMLLGDWSEQKPKDVLSWGGSIRGD